MIVENLDFWVYQKPLLYYKIYDILTKIMSSCNYNPEDIRDTNPNFNGWETAINDAIPPTRYDEDRDRAFSRRALLVGAVGAGAFAAGVGITANFMGKENKYDAEKPLAEIPLYKDERADRAARELNISGPMAFIAPMSSSSELLRDTEERGLLGSDAPFLPIFPPAVMRYSVLIEENARKVGIDPNFLASIITIESAGIGDIISPDGGCGLGQITDRKLKQKMIDAALERGWKVPGVTTDDNPPSADDLEQLVDGRPYPSAHSEEEFGMSPRGYRLAHYKDILTDPEANVAVTAGYLAECLEYADKAGVTGARRYVHAAACYNGGPDEAGKDESEVESGIVLKYRRAMERMVLDLAIGQQLVRNGVDTSEVLRVMQPTEEVNALMFALGQQYKDNKATIKTGAQLYTMQQFAAAETIGDLPPRAQLAMQDYMSGKSRKFTTPATAGLRWWIVFGGDDLLNLSGDAEMWKLS